MEVLYLTIGFTISLAVFFLILFLRSVKGGQFEDTYTPSVRMLFDDELVENGKGKAEQSQNQTINNTKH